MSSQESDLVKICIISSGSVWKAKVACTTKINKLTAMAISHFHGSGTHSSKPSNGRIVLVKTRTILSADKTVGEEGLKDFDEVLLVVFPRPASKQPVVDLRGPTASEIYEATKHLEKRNTEKLGLKSAETEDDLDYSERFARDSPRIYASLIETAARLLAFAPNGMEIFQSVKKELGCKKEPSLHSPLVKQLTDMGFSEEMAVKALTAKKMDFTDAMDWLLEQGSTSNVTDHKEEPSCSQSQTQPLTALDAFQDLLQSALKKRHDNFKVNMKHILQLKLMGYEEKDIEDALRETDNNLKASISCLKRNASCNLSLKKPSSLDPNGSMYKALMGSEIIQLNLKKPKVLFALLAILEDPQCFSSWLKDREVGHILNHLILLHNTETSGGRCMT